MTPITYAATSKSSTMSRMTTASYSAIAKLILICKILIEDLTEAEKQAIRDQDRNDRRDRSSRCEFGHSAELANPRAVYPGLE